MSNAEENAVVDEPQVLPETPDAPPVLKIPKGQPPAPQGSNSWGPFPSTNKVYEALSKQVKKQPKYVDIDAERSWTDVDQ